MTTGEQAITNTIMKTVSGVKEVLPIHLFKMAKPKLEPPRESKKKEKKRKEKQSKKANWCQRAVGNSRSG